MAYLVNSNVLINDARELIGVNTAGINTALYVGGSIQLDATSGIITASNYYGSGANLTDIDAQVLVSDGIPAGISTSEGDLYYDSTDLKLFTYYDNNWVEASPVPPGATTLEVTNEVGAATTAKIDLLTETLILSGTANEVEVGINSAANTLSFGLANDVSIGGSITAGSYYGDGSNLQGVGLNSTGFFEVAGIQAGIVTVTNEIDLNGNIVGNFTNLVSGINTIQTVDLTVNSLGTFKVNDIEPTDPDAFIDFRTGDDQRLSLRVGSNLNAATSIFHISDTVGASARFSTQDDGIRLAGLIQIGDDNVAVGATERGLRFGFGTSGQIVDDISTDLSGTNLNTELVTALAVETAIDSASSTLVTSQDNQDATDYPMAFLSAVGAGASVYTDSTTNEEFTYNPSTGILKVKEFDALSDERLKTDIVRVDDALGKVAQLRGVEYNWKNGSGASVGVIAQEVQEVYPQLVNDNGERLTVNYNGLVGLLIAAVNEMSTELAELKAQK